MSSAGLVLVTPGMGIRINKMSVELKLLIRQAETVKYKLLDDGHFFFCIFMICLFPSFFFTVSALLLLVMMVQTEQ